MENSLKAEIAVPIPIDGTLTYVVPQDFEDTIRIGMRAVVQVRNKVLVGFVCGLTRDSTTRRGLKPIRQMVDQAPVLTEELLNLARWISKYYLAPIGEVLAAMSPPQAKLTRVYRLKMPPGELELEIIRAAFPERAGIIDILSKGKPIGIATIKRRIRCTDLDKHLDSLEKEGRISHEVVAVRKRKPRSPSADQVTSRGVGLSREKIVLTDEQRAAFDGIYAAMEGGRFEVSLLLGVTGSGKTEVYLRCIDQAIKGGRKAIYLVPEIALTPQIMQRVKGRFGHRSALLHSGLSDTERLTTWRGIIAGQVDVVVGARSAVFAPLDSLGVIIVDEEHDASYKQQDSPRYNAREVAIVRARQAGAVVILGSATPTVETYHNALTGKYAFYELPERISGGDLPEVCVVDMRSAAADSPMSDEAEMAIENSIKQHEQVLLFLNRRGFSNYIQCHDCGLVPRCRNCHVSLTYHSGSRQLKCHYCGYNEIGWDLCPKCGGTNIEYVGSGTQKIEDYIAQRFPGTACARFDRDATRRKGSAEALLADFSNGLVRFLVGTQMVAKGHDFKRVGLVVVVNADVSMNLPDLRSGERTFQILTQVAGRAGRCDVPGRVIIQTFNPTHHSLAHVACHDFKGFYTEEAGFRKEVRYPPFARLARVVVESSKRASAQAAAERFAGMSNRLRKDFEGNIDIIGPSRAPISRIKGIYRWHLIVKGDAGVSLSPFIKACMERLRSRGLAEGVRLSVDIDPQVMM